MVATKKAAPVAKKASAHPTFLSMIQECVKSHPEEARNGVSRPTLKKFLAEKYKIDMSSASNTNNLNLAIKRGSEKGDLTLPKGLGGRVKVPAKKSAAADKENVAPVKKAAATKPAAKTATKPAAKAAAKPAAKTAAKPAAKKATTTAAAAKKAPVKKTAAAAKPAAKTAAAKKPVAKKAAAPAKKTASGTKKAPAAKAAATKAAPKKAVAPKKKAAARK